ncbi:MAG: Mur ligase domain-containing protein, partial [Nitrospirota bacterium]
MMTFEQLAQSLRGQVDTLEQTGNFQVSLTAITDDSRAVQAGSLFVAVKGEQVDGHRYISSALTSG